MKKNLSLLALKQMLYNGVELDANSLEKIIFEEAAKPAGKADTELIDAAMDMLLKMDGIEAGSIPEEVSFEVKPAVVDRQRDRFFNYRIPKKWKNLAAACIALIIMCSASVISTLAFGFNFTEELVEWTKEKVVLSVAQEPESTKDVTVYDEIIKEMAKCGNWNLLLPEYLPEEMELIGYTVDNTDASVMMSVFLRSKTGHTLNIVSRNYENEILMRENSEVTVWGNYDIGEKKFIGEHTVYEVLGQRGNSAVFTDKLSIYVVTTSYEEKILDRIILNMK